MVDFIICFVRGNFCLDTDDTVNLDLKSKHYIANAMQEGQIWKNSLRFAGVVMEIGGILPKAAQILSYRADLIPSKQIRRALTQTQENMTPQNKTQVEKLLQNENPTILTDFDIKDSLGTGTVGQAQKIIQKSDQTQFVLKVTFPEIKDKFEGQWNVLQAVADSKVSGLYSALWTFVEGQKVFK